MAGINKQILIVFTITSFLLLPQVGAKGQQVADSSFQYFNPNPAYLLDEGPVVCFDKGHENFHTMHGRYLPFAELLREDGYLVREVDGSIDKIGLSGCDVLLIANPYPQGKEEGTYPIGSAFDEQEISFLLKWVYGGGSLLLIADHSPWPGAVADLAVAFGVHYFEGYTGACYFGPLDEEALSEEANAAGISEQFLRERLSKGSLGDHPIISGRNARDSVVRMMAFGGSAFYGSDDIMPLLTLPPEFSGTTPTHRNLPDMDPADLPTYHLGGWLQGGALEFGDGRAVFLAEAAMCTAQIFAAETERATRIGMNTPLGKENPLFCLNVIRWLSGAIP